MLTFENGILKAPSFDPTIRRAPKRHHTLTKEQKVLAIQNALRYIPKAYHDELMDEFINELETRGKIYGYRFMPNTLAPATSIDDYQGNTIEGKAFQLMIANNLDPQVALYPYELVTYGESGSVFQNWMQYQLVISFLKQLRSDQTLMIASGHPLGVFKSNPNAPRVILTNGLMVGAFDNEATFNNAMAMGVANYGQMTAGGWMYIGPQGIVHGTYNTLLHAGRLKLGLKKADDLSGKLFVSSGLGGMSGAQGKAIKIAKGVGILAEVDESRIKTRFEQGWVDVIAQTPKEAFDMAQSALNKKQPLAIAFAGNIIDLLDYAIKQNIFIDLCSDQTSCHAVYQGGYCPDSMTYTQLKENLATNIMYVKKEVDKSLQKHIELIKQHVDRGTYFFDYGNSFLKAVFDSGVKSVALDQNNPALGFIYPSYVEDILGPQLFDYGFGPFRWVCLSNQQSDLDLTDAIAASLIDPNRSEADYDNYQWLLQAKANALVVGSKARICYQDAAGRLKIALAFNQLVKDKKVGPIMLGRDHHDTGGTDSPFRETSNIKDGSNIMADMATLIYAGNAAFGMSLVALHNGGGVGVSKSINGGFGLVLDGSERVDDILKQAMTWDVMGGVARRSWARNPHAIKTVIDYNQAYQGVSNIVIPEIADTEKIQQSIAKLEEKL